jgi:hypothetical protein
MASAIRQMTSLGGDIRKIARLLQKKAPPGHMLAYINQEEADLLKARGGSGEPHADTGVPSFADDEESIYNKPFEDFGYQYARPASEFHPIPQGSSTELGSSSVAPLEVVSQSKSPFAAYSQATLPAESRYTFEDASTSFSSPSAVDMSAVRDTANPLFPEYQQYLRGQAGTFGDYASAPSGSRYTDENISGSLRDSAARAAAAPAYAPPTQDKDLLGQLSDLLPNLSDETKKRLGIGGIQAVIGAYQSQQAAEQGRKAKEEMAAMAAPYQQQGKELISKAQKGELSPVGQQQLQAVQAQAAQGAQARGGVGAQQAQAQVEAYRQQLLQGQYDYGLKVAGIGDQIMTGAIKTGIQADQYVNQLTSNYYNNIARALYGQAPQVSGSQPASTSAEK